MHCWIMVLWSPKKLLLFQHLLEHSQMTLLMIYWTLKFLHLAIYLPLLRTRHPYPLQDLCQVWLMENLTIYFFTFALIIDVLVLVCLMACYSTWVINSLKKAFMHHWWGLTLHSVYFKGFGFKEECILSQDPCHYGIMMANMVCDQLCVWGLDLSPWPSNRSHSLGSNNSWVYSRLITGLHASNNNQGETVLDVFFAAADVYGVPSCIRGDHGEQWGSYIWGRCDCILSFSN